MDKFIEGFMGELFKFGNFEQPDWYVFGQTMGEIATVCVIVVAVIYVIYKIETKFFGKPRS